MTLTVEVTKCENCGATQKTLKPWKNVPICCTCRKPMKKAKP